MLKKQIKSLLGNVAEASLLKKRLIVLFVFICMSVNGFVSNTSEISKYSFVMMFAEISQNVAVQLLSKCGNSLISVSSKICTDISKAIIPLSDFENPLQNQKEKRSEENTSNNYAVTSLSNLKFSKRLLSEESGKPVMGFGYTDKLFVGDGNYINVEEGKGWLVIFFIIFIIAIRSRKGIGEGIIKSNRKEWKTRISA